MIPLLFYIRNCKPLASLCDCAGQVESTLVANPKDRFSHDEAHIIYMYVSFSGSFFKVKRPGRSVMLTMPVQFKMLHVGPTSCLYCSVSFGEGRTVTGILRALNMWKVPRRASEGFYAPDVCNPPVICNHCPHLQGWVGDSRVNVRGTDLSPPRSAG